MEEDDSGSITDTVQSLATAYATVLGAKATTPTAATQTSSYVSSSTGGGLNTTDDGGGVVALAVVIGIIAVVKSRK